MTDRDTHTPPPRHPPPARPGPARHGTARHATGIPPPRHHHRPTARRPCPPTRGPRSRCSPSTLAPFVLITHRTRGRSITTCVTVTRGRTRRRLPPGSRASSAAARPCSAGRTSAPRSTAPLELPARTARLLELRYGSRQRSVSRETWRSTHVVGVDDRHPHGRQRPGDHVGHDVVAVFGMRHRPVEVTLGVSGDAVQSRSCGCRATHPARLCPSGDPADDPVHATLVAVFHVKHGGGPLASRASWPMAPRQPAGQPPPARRPPARRPLTADRRSPRADGWLAR